MNLALFCEFENTRYSKTFPFHQRLRHCTGENLHRDASSIQHPASSIQHPSFVNSKRLFYLLTMKGLKKKGSSAKRKQSVTSLTLLQGKGSLHSVRSVGSISQMKMQVFQEAFNVIDQDKDGVISRGW